MNRNFAGDKEQFAATVVDDIFTDVLDVDTIVNCEDACTTLSESSGFHPNTLLSTNTLTDEAADDELDLHDLTVFADLICLVRYKTGWLK